MPSAPLPMNRFSPGIEPARSRTASANPNGFETSGPAGMIVSAALGPKRLPPVRDAVGSLHPMMLAHRSRGAGEGGAACATPDPMNSAATGAARTTPAPPIMAVVAAKGRNGFRPRREPVPRSPRSAF
ncbi:hypothetical protein CIW52_22210 [Mycolicibacterium sp. P9-64]|nr:hypothetical protein CIW52_22210 [Mycolicibacterium sp. P9-64]